MFVCLDLRRAFFLGREAHRSANCFVNSLKNVDFSDTYPLKQNRSASAQRYVQDKRIQFLKKVYSNDTVQ